MRLICPNCAAQYEIDAALIPKGGRDVQCSSCGGTWYVAGEGSPDTSTAPETEKDAPEDTRDDAASRGAPADPDARDPGTEATRPATVAADAASPPETLPPPAPEAATEAPAPEQAPATSEEGEGALPPRRELDPHTRAILLEESERESAARRGERSAPAFGPKGAPPQPEPAPVPPPRKERAPEPKAPIPARAAAPLKESRSNPLLPDVAEINSTLTQRPRPRSAPEGPPEPRKTPPPTRRSGVGLGVLVVLLLALALAGLYVAAPAISDAVPALAPLLTGYVGAVNEVREALAGLYPSPKPA